MTPREITVPCRGPELPFRHNFHFFFSILRNKLHLLFLEAPRIRILAIAQRSIKFCWTVKECSPAHPIKGYVVKLADKTGTSEKNTSGIEYTVTNLKPYTEYNVSVRAIRQVEYGTWSNITTTRTAIASTVYDR